MKVPNNFRLFSPNMSETFSRHLSSVPLFLCFVSWFSCC